MMLAYCCVDLQGSAPKARCKQCKRTFEQGMVLQGFCSAECTRKYLSRVKKEGSK